MAIDTGAFQEKFGQLFPDEKDVHISAAGDMLVLSGSVSDSVKAEDVVGLAQAYLHPARAHIGGSALGAAGMPAALSGNVANDASSGSAKVPGVLNMLSVAAPQQVMLEVKVAEIARTELRSLDAQFNSIARGLGNWCPPTAPHSRSCRAFLAARRRQ